MLFTKNKKKLKELSAQLEELSQKVYLLEQQKTLSQAILESMVEAVIAVDRDTRITSINSSAEKIFGITKADAEGKFFLEAIPNNDIAEVINNILKNGEFASKEVSLVWPVQKIFQLNASALFENATVNGCLVVIHDITEIRKLETVRRDFVANVSHELRTPLTSIKGFVETLLEGALEDKENSRHFLEIIRDHSERLNNLINDLLDLSRIESKEEKLKRKDFNLNELASEALVGFKSQLKKKEIEAKNELASGLCINSDRDKIEQVLTNLVDNAIKFNRQNGTIRIYAEDSADRIKIVVEDSGVGIPPKDISRIFERFYRVDKARSRELGGTGLGLSIVKHIIELHGGSVGVESIEGLGSKFWFSLPK